jgi:hypothetical protein
MEKIGRFLASVMPEHEREMGFNPVPSQKQGCQGRQQGVRGFEKGDYFARLRRIAEQRTLSPAVTRTL